MRLLLRRNHFFAETAKRSNLTLAVTVDPELGTIDDFFRNYEPEEYAKRTKQLNELEDNSDLGFSSDTLTEDFNGQAHDLEWETAAPHMMAEGYRYLEPINRAQLAKQKLKKYESSMQPLVESVFEERLISDEYVKMRQAELFLHRMPALTPTFLSQGVNFLSAHVFAKLIEDERPSILKDFLSKGAFEKANFIDFGFLTAYLPHFIDDPRQYFLINILCYEHNLLEGNLDEEVLEEYNNLDDGPEEGIEEEKSEDEGEVEAVGRATEVDEQDMSDSEEEMEEEEEEQEERQAAALQDFFENENIGWEYLLAKCLNIVESHENEFNRLRLYWSVHQLYDVNESYLRNILSELSYVTLKVDGPLQAEVTQEMKHIFTSAYSRQPFLTMLNEILERFKTFHGFITAYTLSIIALSKLKAITRLLPESKSNELHPIFQLIEFNLPKESHQTLILSILTMLSHEDHSRIEYENFKRSYNYWLKDYTQPETTNYHSPISRLLELNENPLTIRYQHNAKCPEYATFTHLLTRNKKAKHESAFIGQRETIKHLLKKDYEPVLNNFITTFSLSTNRQISQKFHREMDRIDKKLQFKNKNEESIYKLKAAQDIFFVKSLPSPLSFDKLKELKQGLDSTITLSDEPINEKDYLLQPECINKFNQLMVEFNQIEREKHMNGQGKQEEDVEEEAEPVEGEELEAAEGLQAGEEIEEGDLVDVQQEDGEQVQSQPVNEEERGMKDLIEAIGIDTLFPGEEKFLIPFEYYDDIMAQYGDKIELEDEQEVPSQDMYELFFADEFVQVEQEGEEYPSDEGVLDFMEDIVEGELDEAASKEVFFKKKEKKESKPKYEEDDMLEEDFERKPSKSEYRGNTKKMFGFNKKNRFEFCTTQPAVTATPAPVFNFEKMNEYRRKEVDRTFLTALQSEQHVTSVSSGSSIAAYLFLHGKNENSNFVLLPNKILNVEFTSVIGTRAKNYERYVQKNLFRYALTPQFYEELLVQQEKKYNRFEFKQIVAHLVHYNDLISDYAIDAICRVCEKERIGYTFVEIAQLIKVNNIRISSQSLQSITNVWQKFDVINEDLLPFLKEYCRKMQIPFKTEFYAQFCKGLIKTKNYEKLEVISNTVLGEIKPKPFKIDSSMTNMKSDQVAVLEKEWKAKQQENYLKLYLELIEVIVQSLDNYVPAYLADYFEDYKKMKPVLNERQLGYAFVCFAHKREKIEELLEKLDKEPEKGTSFMYDCLMQTILSNFQPLEDLSEKMLDVTVLKNRVVLSNPQIMKSMIIFKKSSSSNSFSKFLDHCLRFQHSIHESHEIKREMFYVLNNNVEDVSVGGIFNLLDFIFNEKREKERTEYRAVKLSEEEKSKKLQEIQQSVTKAVAAPPKKEEKVVAAKKDKKKGKKGQEQVQKAEPVVETESSEKEQKKEQEPAKSSQAKKQDKKKLRREKASERQRQTALLDQVLAEQQAKSAPQAALKGNSDQQFISMIKGQTKKHESSKRKSLQSMSTLFQGSLQLIREQQATRAKEAEKKLQAKKETEDKKKDKKKGRK